MFKAVMLGKAKADTAFGKNLEHLLKQRPLDVKAIGKLFFQYGVYLDLLRPLDLPVITEAELDTGEMPSEPTPELAKIPGVADMGDDETLTLDSELVKVEES